MKFLKLEFEIGHKVRRIYFDLTEVKKKQLHDNQKWFEVNAQPLLCKYNIFGDS